MNKQDSVKVLNCFDEKKACEKDLKNCGSTDYSTVVIVGIGMAILGWALGSTSR